jgi:hypothetical protein
VEKPNAPNANARANAMEADRCCRCMAFPRFDVDPDRLIAWQGIAVNEPDGGALPVPDP